MKTHILLIMTLSSLAVAQNPSATATPAATPSITNVPSATQSPGTKAKNGRTSGATAKSSAAKSSPDAASPAEHPTREQIVKLLDLLQIRDNLQLTLDAEKGQLKNGAVETFREKVPVPTPDQLRKINQIVEDAFAGISMDDLISDVIPVYQRHLSRADVTALINFYSSPAGQRIRREQPAIMRESMQASGAAQQQKMELLLAKIEAQMQMLVDEEQKH